MLHFERLVQIIGLGKEVSRRRLLKMLAGGLSLAALRLPAAEGPST